MGNIKNIYFNLSQILKGNMKILIQTNLWNKLCIFNFCVTSFKLFYIPVSAADPNH